MRFEIQLDLPHLELPGPDTQILFHAINKSGSEAVSNVLFSSFDAEGRAHQFHSHFRMEVDQDSFIRFVDSHPGPGFFIDHYLYGWVRRRPRQVMLSQFRHPLPRILSAYHWLKTLHERHTGTPFASLADFVLRTEGKAHCMVLQFGSNWKDFDRQPWLARVSRIGARELYERSLEAIDRDLYAIGIAEHFEESVFLYAKLAGLASVTPWIRDVRNLGRPLSSEIDAANLKLIREVLHLDFALYEFALQKFWKQFDGATFGPSLEAYKAACSDQYNDRIVAPDTPVLSASAQPMPQAPAPDPAPPLSPAPPDAAKSAAPRPPRQNRRRPRAPAR